MESIGRGRRVREGGESAGPPLQYATMIARRCAGPLTLPALLVVLAAPLVAGQRGAKPPTPAAPAAPLFEVVEQSILELQAAQTAGQVTARAAGRVVPGPHPGLRPGRAAAERGGAASTRWPARKPTPSTRSAPRRDRAARCTASRCWSRTTTTPSSMPTCGGALGLATLRPAADAFQVERLRDAGAVILGKTTMHELAAGITTIARSPTRPAIPTTSTACPAGRAAAPAPPSPPASPPSGMGSDTCGSIRIPAANQNLVGLRGTQGLSSRTGIMPLSSHAGHRRTAARSVTDLAIVLDATVGADPADAITAESNGKIPKSFRDSLASRRPQGGRGSACCGRCSVPRLRTTRSAASSARAWTR